MREKIEREINPKEARKSFQAESLTDNMKDKPMAKTKAEDTIDPESPKGPQDEKSETNQENTSKTAQNTTKRTPARLPNTSSDEKSEQSKRTPA